jgi:ribosomal protein S12
MFVFSFLKKAALLGATRESLAGVRFHVVDVNLMALRFFCNRPA